MTDIGKFAVGLKGFPTPNNPEDADAYLLFYFPDKQWSQYVLGALSVLGVGYNWYKSGELDVDEAAEAFRTIVQDAPYNLKTCSNPDGGKIIRVAPSGHVQQLSDVNTWEDPTGDYAIPPVPARTGGTVPDQNCLAAKNAAHVLELLYENVSDSFNDGLSQAAAGVALIEAISLLVGVEFAPITFALVSVSAAIFGAFYTIMEFVTADLWDATFTDTLVCILLECLSNDDGVITFDWDCFNDKLAAQVTFTSLTFDQLRLFGQIQYLLFMVGGVDALNLAGATTAITDDNCDYCGAWCIHVDLTDNDGGFYDAPWWLNSVYSAGVGWQSGFNGSSKGLYIRLDLPAGTQLTNVELLYDLVDPHTTWDVRTCDDVHAISGADLAGVDQVVGGAFEFDVDCIQIALGNCAGCADSGSATLKSVELKGVGEKPDLTGWTDCT